MLHVSRRNICSDNTKIFCITEVAAVNPLRSAPDLCHTQPPEYCVNVDQIVQVLNTTDEVHFIPDTCCVRHEEEPGDNALPYRPMDYFQSVHVSAIFHIQQFVKVFIEERQIKMRSSVVRVWKYMNTNPRDAMESTRKCLGLKLYVNDYYEI